MTDIISEAEAVVEGLFRDAEELFPPKPGGLVDQHRKRKAAEAAAAEQAEQERVPVEQPSYRAVVSVLAPTSVTSLYAMNQVNYPIAGGQQIASVTVPATGTYQVQTSLRIGGAAVAQGNNFQVEVNGVPVATLVQGTGIGQYSEVAFNVTAQAGQTITINAINADATASANVVGQIAATPVPTGTSVILAKDQGMAIGQAGYTLASGIPLPLQTRAQVWAYNPGAAPVQVSVAFEMYAPEK